MPFHHTSGIAAAPGEIGNWFAIFEAWIRLVGWTVEGGAGTENLVIRSLGETGDKTMLFIRVWRVPATNIVRLETMDDAAGTHITTRDGGLNSGAVQITYWMSADLDAIVIVWQQPADWYLRYAGLLMPFAMNPPDETYYSAVADRNQVGQLATILRRHDDLWDQDDRVYYNEYIYDASVDRDDGSFPLCGMYFGEEDEVAGQFKHISMRIVDVAITVLDTYSTHQHNGTTEWIVLREEAACRYALRTGGVEPTGTPMDAGNFAHVTGLAYTTQDFFDALVAFMAGRGFTTNDISGASGRTHDWEFNSAGESGTDDIWIRMSWSGGPNNFSLYVADSALGTVGRHETTAAWMEFWNDWDFPTFFFISGDQDCVLLTLQSDVYCYPLYAGKVIPTAPGLSSTYMSIVAFERQSELRLLLGHDGVWNQNIAWQMGGDGAHCDDSSPNAYDGSTCVLWSINLAEPIAAKFELIGQVKYMYAVEGDAIASFDNIFVGEQLYKKFHSTAPAVGWAMRIV